MNIYELHSIIKTSSILFLFLICRISIDPSYLTVTQSSIRAVRSCDLSSFLQIRGVCGYSSRSFDYRGRQKKLRESSSEFGDILAISSHCEMLLATTRSGERRAATRPNRLIDDEGAKA